MERANPIKNWKYVHNKRKQSVDSADVSVESVQSNRSGKFNIFQFKKGEQTNPYSSRDDLRKEPIFVFTGKSRQKNHEYSILSKRSGKDKEGDISKISDNQMILKGISKQIQKNGEMRLSLKEKAQLTKIQNLVKIVKNLTEEFKRIIASYSKKYRDIRYDWDRSFKQLLALQLNQQNNVINQLKLQLEKKQEEIEQLSRISFQRNLINLASTVKSSEPYSNQKQFSSISKLVFSKIQANKQKQSLSKNNTLAQLLSSEVKVQKPQPQNVGDDVRRLRQTIKKMQQILEE